MILDTNVDKKNSKRYCLCGCKTLTAFDKNGNPLFYAPRHKPNHVRTLHGKR